MFQISFRPTLNLIRQNLIKRPFNKRVYNQNYSELQIFDPTTLLSSGFLYMSKLPQDIFISVTANKYKKYFAEIAERSEVIILEHPWLINLARKFFGPKIVYNSHNIEYDLLKNRSKSKISNLFLRRAYELEKQALKLADLVIFTTKNDQNHLTEKFGLDVEKTVVVPNGVDISNNNKIYTPKEKSKMKVSLGLPENKTLVLFLGSVHRPYQIALKHILK